MSPADFSELMNRFYRTATGVLIKTDAYIDKFVGDEVMAIYLPLFAGRQPPSQAISAAQGLLKAMGYHDPGGPWLPAGIGIHTGLAFFGTVTGSEGTFHDFTALGDTVNTAARIAAAAGPGEALVSEATCAAANLELTACEIRSLQLKGKSEDLRVRVIQADSELALLCSTSRS